MSSASKTIRCTFSAGDSVILFIFHHFTFQSKQAIENITFDRTLSVLKLAGAFAESMGTPEERIGLAGLNPHAG